MAVVTTGTLAAGTLVTWVGRVHGTASQRGLREVWLPRCEEEAARAGGSAPQAKVQIEVGPSTAAERQLRSALGELAEYFAGERQVFTIALDLQGTDFF